MFPKFCSYKIFAVVFSLFSFAVSNVGLSAIIQFSLPVLMLLYPMTIVLIALCLMGRLFHYRKCVFLCTMTLTILAAVLDMLASLPDTVRKTAAIDEDWLGAEQVVEPSGTVILLFTLLRCAMELTRTFLLWYAERKRRRMSIEECVRQSQKLMFKLISLWEIDAALGWETSATYKALADTLPSVKPGEYERVNGLLEKTIYGGIALEPF